ncbi:YibE/F family protein [Streptomyces sp. NPDC059076]|uniref:YibE/F family protein n=1 Tax=unclassified Streptomyces TaxID=2593676 RepID=UPI0036ADF9EA
MPVWSEPQGQPAGPAADSGSVPEHPPTQGYGAGQPPYAPGPQGHHGLPDAALRDRPVPHGARGYESAGQFSTPVPSADPGHGPGSGSGHDHPPGRPSPAAPSGRSHSHSHSHGPAMPVSRHLRKVIAAVLIPFATAVVVGLLVLWPGSAPGHERTGVGFDRQTEQGKVTSVQRVDCKDVNVAQVPPTGDTSTPEGREAVNGQQGQCKKAKVQLTTGKDMGRVFTEVIQPDASRQLQQGQEVVVAYAPDAPRDLQYAVIDVNRGFPMTLLAGIFALAVVLVGRMRGVMALIALVISFAVLTLFILPAILDGSNPLVVAVVGASAIMLVALYLCHGLTARTSVAVLGTLISLLLIGLLGSLYIGWAHLSGNTDDNTGLIHGLYPNIDMSGLLLAGVIIGSLGVLDDVTVTQTSAVWELHQADPRMGPRALYRAGIRIGRDHIASVVNTLVLAYAGAALPLLLLFSIAQSSVGTVANSELVAEEIVRTLIGSIGLVASVPVTTALAALVVSADRTAAGDEAEAGRGSGAPGGLGAPRTAGDGTAESTGRRSEGGLPGGGGVLTRGGKGRRRKK